MTGNGSGSGLDVMSRAELLEAKALAEAADHAKSTFLASMSHELRTPLNAIIGFSELLEETAAGPLTDRQRKYLDNVITASRSLLDLIDQVLDLTREDVGRKVVHLTRFSIPDAIHEVQPLIRALADRKSLVIRVEVEPSLPLILADARKFKQVIYSLLTGAVRTATAPGELLISATHLPRDAEDWFEVTVARPGTDADEDARICEEFIRRTSPTNSNQADLDGLALSRRLVALHGGRLLAEPLPGGGLICTLVMPAAPRLTMPPSIESDDGVDVGHGPLVLVVEDNPEASDLLTHYLTAAGYRVARAFSAEEGLRLAHDLKPAAITMDNELPDGTGLDVVAALRADPATITIPVVVVSVVDRLWVVPVGAVSAWLVKPVDRRQLVSILRELTSRVAA